MTWTAERVDILKKCWAGGLSASQTAGELGGCTRNAVIGKASRMGLLQPDKPPQVGTITRPPRAKKDRFIQPPPKIVKPVLPPDESEFAVSIDDIGMEQCRYPLGDPSLPGFMFCGAGKMESSPYCTRHHRLTHTRAERRPAPSWRAAW